MAVLTTPAGIATNAADVLRRRRGADVTGAVFKWLLIGATVFATGFLAVLLAVMIVDGWDVLSGNLWYFLTHGFSQRSAGEAGIWQASSASCRWCLSRASLRCRPVSPPPSTSSSTPRTPASPASSS